MNIDVDFQELIGPNDVPVRDHYIIECPLCVKNLGYHKKKLYIKTDLSKGFCFRCGTSFFQKQVDPNDPNYKFKYSGDTDKLITRLEPIDCTYYKESMSYHEQGVNYLSSRYSWLGSNYDKLGIKFREDRVVIPFFIDGDINKEPYFYQSRFTSKDSLIRYHIPPSTHKPIYISPVSNITSSKVILCEGVFGAIAISKRYPDYKVIACLGKHVTDYHKFQLSQFRITEFVLYFDDEEINRVVRNELSQKFNSIEINSIESPLGDPEDDYVSNKDIEIKSMPKLSLADELMNILNKF